MPGTPKRRHLLVAVLCAALGILSAAAVAEEAFQLEPGFVRLDNGKNLDGWVGKTDGWSVQDGAIHLDARQAKGDIYASITHSNNCLIRLQFRATQNADSGVYVHGKQLQVRDYPSAGPKPYAAFAKPAGQWNDLHFDITDGVAEVRLNGQVIEKAWKIGGDAAKGLGLQRERGDFDFRYLRLKEK